VQPPVPPLSAAAAVVVPVAALQQVVRAMGHCDEKLAHRTMQSKYLYRPVLVVVRNHYSQHCALVLDSGFQVQPQTQFLRAIHSSIVHMEWVLGLIANALSIPTNSIDKR
jgi:hypothetical protein